MELHERVREFTKQTVAAMCVPLEVTVVDAATTSGWSCRVTWGCCCGAAEALDALQQTSIPRSAGAEGRSVVVVRLHGLSESQEAELRQMARS